MGNPIEAFYTRTVAAEWARMDRHPLEFELTKRHIAEVLEPGSEILDLGGGPGRYSFHYAALGHAVTLVDLTPANVDFARARQAETGLRLRDALVGDARSLPFLADGSFDLVLCMGPLYHLVEEAGRAAAIAECRRLVRPGGHIVFTFITRLAQAMCLIKEQPGAIAAWDRTLRRGLDTGRNDPDFDNGFTEAFFVDPLEVEGMLRSEDLELVKLAGAEGFACQSEVALKALGEEAFRNWVDLSFDYSTDRSTLGANDHLVAVVRKRAR
jgi:S-adenosylmethionine-dependent methyltransferase